MLLTFSAMLAFAVIHSLTAMPRWKIFIARRVGQRNYEGLYRLVYNLFSAVLILPITAYVFLGGDVLISIPPRLHTVMAILQGLGLLGGAIALLQIDMWRFAGIRQALAWLRGNHLPLPEEALKTNGMFGIVRHPLYLFALIILWTTFPLTDRLFVYNLMASVYFVIGARFEEQRMLREYGQRYRAYRNRVPAFVPFLRTFTRPLTDT